MDEDDLPVDEDDLQWVANEKKIYLLLKQFHKNLRSKTRFKEINPLTAGAAYIWVFIFY